MERKTMICPVEFKAVEGKDNYVTGIASVFGNIDGGGDVVEPGAFKKTIKERIPKKLVKFVDSHIWDSAHTLGTVEKAKETEEGLYFEASLSVAPSVQDTKIKMLEGHISKVSFGYDVIQDVWERLKDGTKRSIRRLKELKLYEISVCPLAMNEETGLLSVKGLKDEDITETEKDIKINMEDVNKFEEESIKQICMDEEKGVKADIGKYKSDSDDSPHIQSYHFSKGKDWTKEKAIEWVENIKEVLSCFGTKEQGLILKPLMIAEPGKNSLTVNDTFDMKARALGIKLSLQRR